MQTTTTRRVGLWCCVAAAMAVTFSGTARAQGAVGTCEGCCAGCGPLITVTADALFLHRSRAADRTLALDENGSSGFVDDDTPLLGVGDLTFDYEPGVALSLTRHLDGCRAVQGVYFGLSHWNATGLAVSEDNLQVPFPPGDTFVHINADAALAEYTSQLHNAELNVLERMGDSVQLLYGVRYLNLYEDFLLRTVDESLGAGNPLDISDYRIATHNSLVGLQLGGQMEHCLGSRLRLGVSGKAGLFANFSEQKVDLRDVDDVGEQNTVILRRFNDRETNLAFVGELGATLSYQLTCTLAVRGGYRLMWVEGVALAPDQLDFGSQDFLGGAPHQALQHGGLLYDGAFAGLEWRR